MTRWTETDLKRHQARRAGKKPAAKLGRSRANTASGRVEKVERDGIVFDSKREADRWSELRLLKAAGEIADLRRQVEFAFVVNRVLIGRYRADFTYRDREGKEHVEDAKGHRTERYLTAKKLMRACYGIEIEEV